MNTKLTLALVAAGAASLFSAQTAKAQETVVETVSVTEIETTSVPCKTHYYSTAKDNWFIQIGAGVAVPFVENNQPGGTTGRSITANYNLAFGKWFSPYMAWRLGFNGGAIHWNNGGFSRAKTVNANLDFMWDMFNSLGGVNTKRVFSIVPFVGLGGAFTWDYDAHDQNVINRHGKIKHNEWTLPVSAGLQFRFRLSKYADFFLEGRAQFHGDSFNNYVIDAPVDVNITATGGFTFYIGGADFKQYNPCDYLGYINSLNNQVNDLRSALNTTSAALAAAEAQLPCPEVKPAPAPAAPATPLLSTVRFKLNSSVISDEEAVNVYNIAQWMKANPTQKVDIVGYADKDTGTSTYNMALSKRRAQAVYDQLTKKYGISADRLTIQAEGSSVQPYDVNNWNRIVIFSNK